jgi:hypothetical protein
MTARLGIALFPGIGRQEIHFASVVHASLQKRIRPGANHPGRMLFRLSSASIRACGAPAVSGAWRADRDRAPRGKPRSRAVESRPARAPRAGPARSNRPRGSESRQTGVGLASSPLQVGGHQQGMHASDQEQEKPDDLGTSDRTLDRCTRNPPASCHTVGELGSPRAGLHPLTRPPTICQQHRLRCGRPCAVRCGARSRGRGAARRAGGAASSSARRASAGTRPWRRATDTGDSLLQARSAALPPSVEKLQPHPHAVAPRVKLWVGVLPGVEDVAVVGGGAVALAGGFMGAAEQRVQLRTG